ncbi:unnamed protein product [marine sediment metagenome]|uniref:Uncharacterized protein n=1 Tax=marine sediment metagenome TaxID=412755 RepID=X1B144_9ZZZZ
MPEVDDLTEINLDDFKKEPGAEGPTEPEEEIEKEELPYVEVSIPTEMLIALVGGALSCQPLKRILINVIRTKKVITTRTIANTDG